LQQTIQRPKKAWDKLAIPTLDGLLFYNITNIVYLEAASNYTVLYFSDNTKVTASKTLKDFEELLPEDQFFRVHHSHLINLHFVQRYIRGDGGQVELINGKYLDVARRKKEAFLEIISKVSFSFRGGDT
jgi:two-component system LytT family response regulator